MASDNARILVIGAGVNGSVLAERLLARGVNVTVLARGSRLADIRANGIVIEDPLNQRRRIAKVKAIGELAIDDIYDYILVVVRRNQVAALLPSLAANHSPNVVFMSNSLTGPAEILSALGPQRPLLGFVFAGGKRDGNLIRAIGPFNFPAPSTPFGEISGSITPRLMRLVALFNRAGLRARASTQIVDHLATHAAGVAAITPLGLKLASQETPVAPSFDEFALSAAAIRETYSVLRALGHKIVPVTQSIAAVTPVPVLAFLLRLLVSSKLFRYGGVWHIQQAPDELDALVNDLRAAVIRSRLPVPALRKVLAIQ
jgi:2-dehydropantoate 2-reductase